MPVFGTNLLYKALEMRKISDETIYTPNSRKWSRECQRRRILHPISLF